MAFRRTNTILNLREYDPPNKGVEYEADIIFTAAFIGLAMEKNTRNNGLAWRLDLEPNTDAFTNLSVEARRPARTADDQRSMKLHNDLCSKVNHVVRNYTGTDAGGVSWGLTPVFDRGGMICAGPTAQAAYSKVQQDPKNNDKSKEAWAKVAFRYLSTGKDDSGNQDMYVGRGAYCGVVLDGSGAAINAMSTIRTTLKETTAGVGTRWVPPAEAPVRGLQYPSERAVAPWGIIRDLATQTDSSTKGMRFLPKGVAPDPARDTVAYTHGMVRAVYETERLKDHARKEGPFTAFEMSIGTDTFKLASCLSCSTFMIANGADPSSSHLGRGESWGPYYDTYTAPSQSSQLNDGTHNWSHIASEEEAPLSAAIRTCNGRHAAALHRWLTEGVRALQRAGDWVQPQHQLALAALATFLEPSRADNNVARDLYLDAMTFHKSDAARLNDTLRYGSSPRRFCNENYDWIRNEQTDGTTLTHKTWVNYFTEEHITALHAPVVPLRA